MKFERDLPEYPQSIDVTNLREGTLCFRIVYNDREMLVPSLKPVVFVGRDLEAEDQGIVYFQDYDSYRDGVRYDSPPGHPQAEFETFEASQRTVMFSFENAIDDLLLCLMRRRAVVATGAPNSGEGSYPP